MSQILFICSANKDRSKTAEVLFSSKYPNHTIKSAGTNHAICSKIGSTALEEHHLEWADAVFVMETKHLEIIQNHTGDKYTNKIETLHIPDIYQFGSSDLKTLLIDKIHGLL